FSRDWSSDVCSSDLQHARRAERDDEANQSAGALQPRHALLPCFLLLLVRHGYTRSRAAAAPIAAGKARITTLAMSAWSPWPSAQIGRASGRERGARW